MVDFAKMLERMEARDRERTLDPKPRMCVTNVRSPLRDREITSMCYVGRPMPGSVLYNGPSPLGSPYSARQYGKEQAIALYRAWLWEKMKDTSSEQYRRLLEVLEYSLSADGVALGCWCAPEPCHAEVILRAVNYLWEQGVRPEGWFPGKGISQSWRKREATEGGEE